MGRWVDNVRERQPRDWMLPGTSPEEADEAWRAGADVTTAVPDRSYRTPWARGPRAPLRRNQGVPSPLETPLYVHHAELLRARASRRTPPEVLAAWSVAAAVVLAVLVRLILGQ